MYQNINQTLEKITKYNEEYKSQTGNYYINPVEIDKMINIPAAPPPPPPQKLRPMKTKKETLEEEPKPAPVKRKITQNTRPTTKPRVTFTEPEIKTEPKTTKKKGAKNEEIDVSKMKLTKEMKKDAYEILDLVDEYTKLKKETEQLKREKKPDTVKIKENDIQLFAQDKLIRRRGKEYGENYKVSFNEAALRAYRELHDKPKEEPPKEEVKEEKPKTESPKKESPKKETKEETKEETSKTPKKSDGEEKPAKTLT